MCLASFLADVLNGFRFLLLHNKLLKCSGLKQNLFISPDVVGGKSGRLMWVPCLGSHNVEIKISVRLVLSGGSGKSPFPGSFRLLAEANSLRL